jgi:peptidoglycan/LPS O-acetylase OafA/YrhL
MDKFWPAAAFTGGILLAEIEAILEEMEFTVPKRPTTRLLYYIFWYSNLMFGLLVFGWPESNIDRDPLIKHLLPWTPQIYLDDDKHYRFWHVLTAVQVTWCAFRLPLLQRFFTTPFSLYLGDVSYAIYIVHMHWILSVGRKMHWLTDQIYGSNRGLSGELNLIVAGLMELGVVMTLVFIEGDFFWRYVDGPSVTFAKWVEKKVKYADESEPLGITGPKRES